MEESASRERGFTLIELVIVIVITGIVSGVVTVFVRSPIQGYMDTTRRIGLSDTADVALRQINRDLGRALPNSVRVSADGQSLEFFPTLVAGRYFADATAGCFVTGCSSIAAAGSLISASGDYVGNSVVIFNYYNNAAGGCSATSLPSAYCGHNQATISGSSSTAGAAPQTTFTFPAAARFYPSGGSPMSRLYVVSTPVSYVCDLGSGTLTRYSGYPMSTTQPTTYSGAVSAVVASDVSACVFAYTAGATQRSGLVVIRLSVTRNGETAGLYQEVHVNNSP